MFLFLLFTLLVLNPIYGSTYQEVNPDFFTRVYQINAWGGKESKSGPGSGLQQTTNIRDALPALFKQLGVKVLLDLPCGDFFWMKEMDLAFLDLYIGGDIVSDLITANIQKFSSEKRTFKRLDIIQDNLPTADLLFCRDCFQHLTDECIKKAVNNIKKSKSKYLLTSSFPKLTENKDIPAQFLKVLIRTSCRNLQLPPFNFPTPLYVFEEGFLDKTLALWRIEDLPDYDV